MLFLTSHLGFPAFDGIPLNVAPAHDRHAPGRQFRQPTGERGAPLWPLLRTPGFTRLLPVLMTAGAIIMGMIPMPLGSRGWGANAHWRGQLSRIAVCTCATLIFVPTCIDFDCCCDAAEAHLTLSALRPMPSFDMQPGETLINHYAMTNSGAP